MPILGTARAEHNYLRRADDMGDNHDGIVKRLRRIEGQVSGIRKMQEGARYCIDVLDQISAARAGLEATAL